MSKSLSSFALPEENNRNDKKFVYYRSDIKDHDYKEYWYNKSINEESNSVLHNYLSIENDLIETFYYVMPNESNLLTSSTKFATIIREACNLYENLSRDIYLKLYNPNSKRLNIFNFLSLDIELKFSSFEIICPQLAYLPKECNILQPFSELHSWNKKSEIIPSNIPAWWNAYNKIKHEPSGFTKSANLLNSLRSVAGVYSLINTIFGQNLTGNKVCRPEKHDGLDKYVIVDSKGSSLFICETGALMLDV